MTYKEAVQLAEMEFDWDWEKFRREAAKDILAGLCANTESFGQCANLPAFAIDLADELIKRLKEDKK